MPKHAFPAWKGFELAPHGSLLDQTVDLSGQMGFAYERSLDFYKDFHIHDRLMLVFPRGSCVMEIRSSKPTITYKIDSGTVLTVPADLVHDDEGKSSIYDTLALFPEASLIDSVISLQKIKQTDLEALNSKCLKIKRTAWLEQLVQEYFFRRVLSTGVNPDELKFFERQILSEVLRITVGKRQEKASDAVHRLQEKTNESAAGRALRHIESNLFSALPLEQIARQAGTSVSVLLRQFRKELKLTPYQYIKSRRLEEAMHLLKKGKTPIGQIATLVGYDNFGAFSEAFKQKYGKPPSTYTP